MKQLSLLLILIAIPWLGAGVPITTGSVGQICCLDSISNGAKTTTYAMGMVFRETPFADLKGAEIVDKRDVDQIKHFELDYDSMGRLVEVRYMLNDQLVPYTGRFVRAPKICMAYRDSLEIRTYFNEFGHRTMVAGNVYSTVMVRDANGNRKRLTFLGLNGEPVANDFGIASYQWKMESEGQVIESRYDLEGHLVRNRPEFQFMVTRFGFDDQGMLKRMTNLGLDGEHITLDDAGAAHIEVQYDVQGRLVEWANYDDKGQLVIGMTGIAKILYEPSRYGMEQKASFFDQNHNPLSTRWGVHSVVYQFDAFGNVVDRRFLGVSNEPVNTKNGLGIEKTTYSSDGRYVHTTAYLDASENPIGFGPNQIHGTTVKIDHQGRPVKTYFRNLEGQIADGWYGYAIENRVFDQVGRLVAVTYLDAKGSKVDHTGLGVAEFSYSYNSSDELLQVEAYDKVGNKVDPTWNPDH